MNKIGGADIKLYNLTKIPDTILLPVLADAGKLVGSRTAKVIVRVAQGRVNGCRGYTNNSSAVSEWFLLPPHKQKNKSGKLKMRPVRTDGGFIGILVPDTSRYNSNHPTDAAMSIFRVACHEWQHIKQFQKDTMPYWNRELWRKNYLNRPWEQDAIKAASRESRRISKSDSGQDHILDLALHYESK